jgi:hypothetical protein
MPIKEEYLRDRLLRVVIDALTQKEVTLEEALAACVGAAATVLGTYPESQRETVALALDGTGRNRPLANPKPATVKE